jgi:hypothetical protein
MKNVLILERSSQNLKKVSQKGKTILEGVFAEFGVENRNGRVYEEKEYLPHLEYLKKDIATGSLLGELDHPERFEVALSNVSHRVTELWYDQNQRQIKGRIEILEGTPKGQIAKSLLDSGIPLSISSRAAGTVNEDKTVAIQQIYTYDLVAKPGFEKAQLETVNESVKARIENQISQLNESYSKFQKEHKNLTPDLGIINEQVSIFDVTDKYPGEIALREEAQKLVKNKSEEKMENVNEEKLQQWTVYVKNELSKTSNRLAAIENAILEGTSKESQTMKSYVEELRKLNEKHLAWTASIAKNLNKVANHSQVLAEKSNDHYKMTKKMSEVVDYNAKVLNHTQDWVGNNANVTNAIAETVDFNAEMLNGINEWNTQLARGVNALHEWGTEKAKAINEMHEWTASIAKNLNVTANWSEEMFGRAMSKSDAKKLVDYIELVSESKSDPKLKEKIDEILTTHGITEKPLNESMITGIKGIKGLGVITDVTTTGNSKVDTNAGKDNAVKFDGKTIVAQMKKGSKVGGGKPKELKTLDSSMPTVKLGAAGKIKGIMTLDVQKKGSKPSVKIKGEGPTPKMTKDQNLKLDTKPVGKLAEDFNKSSVVREKRSKLDEKLSKIIDHVEKEKKLDEDLTKKFPFLGLLSEGERKQFGNLNSTQKEKVATEISKNPTTDTGVIRKLWESALAEQVVDTNPLWLKIAPAKFKQLYEKAGDIQKEAIKARAEFYELNTQYQINNFWETSGLIDRPLSINEVYVAKSPEESDQKLDSFVAATGEYMKRFNR